MARFSALARSARCVHCKRRMMKSTLSACVLLLLSPGCVYKQSYDEAVADSQRAAAALRAHQAQSRAEREKQAAQLATTERSLADAQERGAEQARELQAAAERLAACRKTVDEATAHSQQLRGELERQGRNVDELLSSKGALASSLAQARARLEELRRAQAAAESRAALFRDLAVRLRRMIDAGDLEIALRSGRMVLVLPTDVLFDSGKARLGARGTEALSQLGSVLTTLEGRRFQVTGHTDDDPIRYSGFESNWELSTERALAVVKVLVASGMKPSSLSAAGYAEFDPVVANDSAEHKAKNRRIEISLQPNIDELVALPPAR